MPQNRNKLIQLLIGNLVNVVVHKVLEEAVTEDIMRNHYDKESLVSLEISKKYREQINPLQRTLPNEDVENIKTEVLKRAKKELMYHISKGYTGIKLELIEEVLDKLLDELKIG
ncbi:hypothetical protein HZC30_03425 [Candidatus Woesearchaeota archaeon]|nr:hypothetical protein [Candidatus Woesearchaeota archaeon]